MFGRAASGFEVSIYLCCSVPRSFNSPELSVTGLESPRAASPVETGSSTPKAVYSAELPAEGNTPPASGSTTPTTETGKMSRFIGLSPIAGFLRARYPSAIRAVSVKPVSEAEPVDAPEPPASDEGAEDQPENDEDRRTIRGDVAADAALEEAGKANGVERGSEKLGDVPVHAPPAISPPPTPAIK